MIKELEKIVSYGNVIKISTLDNPGWDLKAFNVTIEINPSVLVECEFFNKGDLSSENQEWVYCGFEKGTWFTSGGPYYLSHMLNLLKQKVEGKVPTLDFGDLPASHEVTDLTTWLQAYYASCTDEDWEHMYGIRIESTAEGGWEVCIDLDELNLDDMIFSAVETAQWRCWKDDTKFRGVGGPMTLVPMLTCFREWVGDTVVERLGEKVYL